MLNAAIFTRAFSSLGARVCVLPLLLAGLLLPVAAQAQVSYTGSTASQNLGSLAIGSPGGAQTLNFAISAGTTVGSIAVVTQGAPNLDFTQATGSTCTATAYASATSCTVNVTFEPKFAGLRMGAVVFYSEAGNNGTQLASVPIYGVGTGPQIAYGPGTAIALHLTLNGQQFPIPTGLAVDAAGDLFISLDSYYVDGNESIAEMPAGGGPPIVITPVVNGKGLVNPVGVAVDGAGDLFIADSYNNRVVEVPAGGGAAIAIGPTIHGVTLSSPYNLAVDGQGDLFIAMQGFDIAIVEHGIVELPAGGGAGVLIDPTVNGIAVGATGGVAVDAKGDLFIADQGNGRVVEVPAGGGAAIAIGTTVNGEALDGPEAVSVDGAGDLFIADFGNERVVEVPGSGGAAIAIRPRGLDYFNGLAVDSGGDIFLGPGGTLGILEIQRSQPPDLNFPTGTFVGSIDTADGTQTVQIQNIGNEALTLTALSYPPDFPEVSGDASACTGSTSLSGGQECDLPIEFAPENVGSPLNEDVMLTDNTLNVSEALQSIGVSGAGLTMSPATHFSITTPAFVFPGIPFTMTVAALDASNQLASTYNGTVRFTSTDGTAELPGASKLTGGIGTFHAMLATLGKQTITATDSANSITGTSSQFSVAIPYLVVTTAADDAGAAANCTVQAAPSTGTDAACSLRDALLAAAGNGVGQIGFDAMAFATAQTITLANGTLTIPTNTSIAGPTMGAGATLTNLVTVNGAGQYQVFSVPDPTATASLSNLTISNGGSTGMNGGAINNQGSLTVTNSTFSGNSAQAAKGGAMFNNGTMTVSNSTFVGNTASTVFGEGGAIFNYTSLTVNDSTFTGNEAGCGGALFNNYRATLTNTTISGNTGGCAAGIWNPENSCILTLANNVIAGNTAPDIGGAVCYIDNGGNLVGVRDAGSTRVGTGINPVLAPLGSYGGPTQTMVPLPGSPALCVGTAANATAAGLTGDQRGFPFDPACPSGSVDSGAVQSNYALAFTTEPPATTTAGQALLPAPVVGLTESGAVASIPASAVTMTDSAGLLTGTLTANLALGSATFWNLIVSSPASSDLLTAKLALTSGVNVTAQSSPIQVNAPPPDTLYQPSPGSVLTSSAVIFAWSPLAGATGYSLWIGSTGVGSSNLHHGGNTTATSDNVVGLPTNGETLYVRLNTTSGGVTVHSDYTYTAVTLAALITPAPSSVLTGPNVTFTWSAASGAAHYSLWLGSTGVGSYDLFSSDGTAATSVTAYGLPTNGAPIYARLNTWYNDYHVSVDYVYTAATLPQEQMTSPTPGSTLTGSTVTFTWTGATGATAYSLALGSTGVGSHNLYTSEGTASTSLTVNGLPTNGKPIYARLYTWYNNKKVSIDYVYTAP